MNNKDVKKNNYREFRCTQCKKLLFKGVLIDSAVEVKCKRCGNMNIFNGEPAQRYLCLIADTCPHKVAVIQQEDIK